MKTTQAIADETGESTRTIQRYKKLLELSEPLVKMVDNGRISLRAAGVLADLNVNTQNRLAEDLRDNEQQVMTIELAKALVEREKDGQEISLCALPGFVDSKNEEKTERNAGYLVVSHSGGGMLRQGTRKGIRRTPANRGMRAHWVVKGLDISEDVCHGMCP